MRQNSKRHTKPCVYYQTNTCPLSSEECDYAHVIVAPEQLEALKSPQATLRTKPCKFFLAGQCKDGYWCRFKHPASLSSASLSLSDNSAPDEQEGGSERSSDEDADVRDVDPSWKGKPDQHPKYRTRPCRNYLLGKCAYGDRCSYLHAAASPNSPMSALASPHGYFPLTPPASAYFPKSPPLLRAPHSTPVDSRSVVAGGDAASDVMDVDMIAAAPVAGEFGYESRTPSNSSHVTDEPPTPATPGRGPFAYPESKRNHSVPVASSPYALYSPTSPIPMTIVHVPIAVPMYQSMASTEVRTSSAGAMRVKTRPRSLSQPHVETGSFSPRGSHFKTKPCKFFSETGRCHKGDKCNFIHIESACSPSSQPHDDGNSKDNNMRDAAEELTDASQEASEKPENFYKINWRVVGGGVMMGPGGMLRRHSEDTTARPVRGPTFRNPFSSESKSRSSVPNAAPSAYRYVESRSRLPPSADEMPSPLSLGSPIDTKSRAGSLPSITNSESSTAANSGSSSEKRNVNALALTLQSYSITSATKASTNRPIVVVQDDEDNEKIDWSDDFDEVALATNGQAQAVSKHNLSVPAHRGTKSSPSSPVTAALELPISLFSAESP